MKTKQHILWMSIMCIYICIIIVFYNSQSKSDQENESYERHDSIITRIDTFFLPGDTILNPEPYAVHDTVLDTVCRTAADTAKAIKDYQLTRAYRLPVVNDSNGKIDVNVNVQFNKIASWSVSGELYNRVYDHHHYERELPQLKFYAGIQTGIFLPDKVIAAPTGVLLTRKGHLYSAGYDPLNKALVVGAYWKLFR